MKRLKSDDGLEIGAAADATAKANAAQNNAEAFASGLDSAMSARVAVFEKQPGWIVVAPSGGDYTTLTAAFAAHTEEGARFLVRGAITEPESADQTRINMIYTPPAVGADTRILEPRANQHIHFCRGTSITLGSWRMLALRSNGIVITADGPVTIDVGQSPDIVGISLNIAGTGLDFNGVKFNVVATRAHLSSVGASGHEFFLNGSIYNSRLGEWDCSISRSMSLATPGTPLTNVKFFNQRGYLKNSEFKFRLLQAEQTAPGVTISNVYGAAFSTSAPTLGDFDASKIELYICTLPAATENHISLVGYSYNMNSAGFRRCFVRVSRGSDSVFFSNAGSNSLIQVS